MALYNKRAYAAAAAKFQSVVGVDTKNGHARLMLGVCQLQMSRWDAAAQSFVAAYALNSNDVAARDNLYYTVKRMPDVVAGEGYLRQLCAYNPNDVQNHIKRSEQLERLNRDDEALAVLEHVCAEHPTHLDARAMLAFFHFNRRRYAMAVKLYTEVLQQAPENAHAHFHLATALERSQRYLEAIVHFDRCLALQPDYEEARIFKAGALTVIGRMDEAEQLLRTSLAHKNSTKARSLLVFLLNYRPQTTYASLAADTRPFQAALEQELGAALTPYTTWNVDVAVSKRLRIGFVSPDFIEHPVGRFFENVLKALAGHDVETFLYSINGAGDAVSERLRAQATAWRTLAAERDYARAAAAIHADAIDVLFDLAGHTSRHRLELFAYKPAPVQVSWLGYFGTTGVKGMDYILGDPVATPLEEQAHFTEQIVQLSASRLSFTPPLNAPPIAPLPMPNQGHFTFACYQGLKKVTDEALRAWGQILAQCEESRLHLHSYEYDDAVLREGLRSRMAAMGVDGSRVSLIGGISYADYLSSYAKADVLLDTFPFTGGTTTAEGLWMGLPTVTLRGNTMVARQGASLMQGVGLGEWVQTSVEDYIAFAVTCSKRCIADSAPLAALRAGMRDRLTASPVFNAALFATDWVAQVRSLWTRYVHAQKQG